MGSGSSKKGDAKKSTEQAKPKTMPYKRQFSSDVARQTQQTTYSEYRQATLSAEQKNLAVLTEEEKQEANAEYDVKFKNNAKQNLNIQAQGGVAKYDNDVLDPNKYKPPPSPAIPDSVELTMKTGASNEFVKRKESIKEEEDENNESDEDDMTDAEALQIKQTTQRALVTGTNLIAETKDGDDEEKENDVSTEKNVSRTDDDNDNEYERSNSTHYRVESKKLDHSVASQFASQSLVWGYCELTRKQLDEDQAAFLTWTHPTDGFVHAWAIFDGHGGYETALYSSQHFLKYVQKYHLTRTSLELSSWPSLMKEIFLKFDEHIGNLNIRGGTTVVVVLLINTTLIVANAGDARAIMSHKDGTAVELSYDHSPMNDYDRLFKLCKTKENHKKINRFFRINPKNETYADVQKLPSHQMRKAPFISREQDKSRLLGTIGVARGFGDFTLSVFGFRSIKLKPFLSAEPYVFIKELKEDEVMDTDVMCIACDGVFDVMTNQEVIDILRREIFFRKQKNKIGDDKETIKEDKETDDDKNNKNDDNKTEKSQYTKEANININVSMIDRACGFLGLRSYAKGTMDDVSVFTIPLRQVFDFCKFNNQQ